VHNKINLKRYIVPLLFVLMWVGLLWSRALLSTSMIIFIGYALATEWKEGFREVRSSLWLKGLVILFIIPLISGIWSSDLRQWWSVIQVKLPLLFFPFCVPVFRDINEKTRKQLLWILLGMLGVSMGFSLGQFYVLDAEDYLKAKVLKVAVYDDHVRYSWLLVIGYSWLLYEVISGRIVQRKFAFLVLILIGIYLHVLAAKTGLVGFYFVNFIAVLINVPSKYKLRSIGGLLLLPLLAWFLIPTFQNRLKFVLWDFQNYSRGNYVEGLSDAPRVLSWKAAVEITKSFPIRGVGAGDVIPEMKSWYTLNAPYLKEYEKIMPSNEGLLYAVYAGVLGGLMALLIFLLPFSISGYRRNMLWLSFHTIAFIGFMYDLTLELQFGVFMYMFFSILFYSQVKIRGENSKIIF
jgi:O-antigen ligase